ncbi:MAG: hypothetical protein H6835_00810 [Planctomycetes bacterium]|nr:hypothetical protein [Planctomycetota bacterium]
MQQLLRSAVLVSAATLALPAAIEAQDVYAWAWVDPPAGGGTFTPAAAWRYSSSGSVVTVTRDPVQANVFTVTVPNITSVTGGVVHATAHGGNHTAVVGNWLRSGNDIVARIALFTPTGAPANNANFSFSYRFEGPDTARQAHMWANQPSSASYTPAAAWLWNGNRADPTITRTGPGNYRVLLPGLGVPSWDPEQGHVQVTPYGGALVRASVLSWSNSGNDKVVYVRTFAANGVQADASFVLSYNEAAAPIDETIGSGAHVYASYPNDSFYVPDDVYTDSNGRTGPHEQETVRRLGLGQYVVNLPDVAGSSSSNAQVTPYGLDGHYANLAYWGSDGCGGTDVRIDTFDAAGNPDDARFNLLYLTDRPARTPAYAWGLVEPDISSPTFTAQHQFSTAEGSYIYATRHPSVANRLIVRIPGIGRSTGGVVSLCSRSGHTLTVINSWGRSGDDVLVNVDVFTQLGTPHPLGVFAFCFQEGGLPGERRAYCWANQPTAASYNPHPGYAWNDNRGAPVITRTGTGAYQVRFPGLASTGSELGSVMVTPKSGSAMRAMLSAWFTSGNDVVVNVRCYTPAGSAVDGEFTCVYEETAARMPREQGSGAHVFANSPTTVSYTPNPAYTDSNGIAGPHDSESIRRLTMGDYLVTLPDCAPGLRTLPMVTATGVAVTTARITGWGTATSTGSEVRVWTENVSGNPVDAPFTLFFFTSDPAAVAATNAVLGNGCHGPSLEAMTRPVLCRDWHLKLDVPGTSVAGLLLLGTTNPALSLDPLAPGCTLYTDAAVISAHAMPLPTPIYTLSVPQSATLLGIQVYAQGGSLVPGINAVSLALSNGLRGTIGEF